MANTQLIPSLFGITMIAVLLIAVVGFAMFMRKRRNRHPMDSAEGHAIDAKRDEEAKRARR